MFLIFYVVYPIYNILYLINSKRRTVTHIWVTVHTEVYPSHRYGWRGNQRVSYLEQEDRHPYLGDRLQRKYTRHIDVGDCGDQRVN